MTPLQRLEELFNNALDMPATVRAAYLDRECRNDADLRRRAERLLAEFDCGTTGVLANTPDGAGEPPDPVLIGSFKIVRVIGEGGMGRVYEATQDSPRRSVALKVIRSGLGTREGHRRFAREAELLAQLKHAGIAQIYSSGIAPDDRGLERRYIAMELVRGNPLIFHATQARLSIPERIQLLARVCDAVQHAHQRGVIHRDLKPANILVEIGGDDPVGQPKVLDFGVARLLDTTSVAHSQATEAGRIIGTLAYMSPEQVEGDQRLIDTRTDVYALGAMGYELLGGAPPTVLVGKSLVEAARIIRDVAPRRLGETSNDCRGDVETIIAKAMEKDRERRYAGAGDLAADLRRFLRHEPILARAPSTLYQLARFTQRHKAVVAGASLALAALLAGLVVSTVQYARAARAAQRSDQVAGLLKRMIGGINPKVAQARDTSLLKEIMDSSVAGIGDTLRGQPTVEAELRSVIGEAYLSIGEYPEAEAQFRAATEMYTVSQGRRSGDVASTLMHLADVLRDTNQTDASIAAAEEALSIRRGLYGESSDETAEALGCLGEALRHKDIAAAIVNLELSVATSERVSGHESLAVGRMLEHLGGVYIEAGRSDDAEKALTRSYQIRLRELGPDNLDTANVAGLIGDSYMIKQRYAEAEPLCRLYAAKVAKVLPATHPAVPLAWASLALAIHRQGRLGEAIELYRAQIPSLTKAVGRDNLNVGTLHSNLGNALTDAGEFAAAEPEFAEALRIYDAAEGPESLRRPSALLGLANMNWGLANYAGSAAQAREAYVVAKRVLPARHAVIGTTALRLSACQIELAIANADGMPPVERAAEAETLAQAALADFVATVGADHFNSQSARSRLAIAHATQAVLGMAAHDHTTDLQTLATVEKELRNVHDTIESQPGLGSFPARDLLRKDIACALARLYTAQNAAAPAAATRELALKASAEVDQITAAIAAQRRETLIHR